MLLQTYKGRMYNTDYTIPPNKRYSIPLNTEYTEPLKVEC
jgi:hypothetical protein